jgi:hypothetical protein
MRSMIATWSIRLPRSRAFALTSCVPNRSSPRETSLRCLTCSVARYRVRGRFPRNPDFAEPTPYFVDASGTGCAVAHLLELGGGADLVARIARERNNAYVHELVDEPRLLAWLAAAGLTVEEAAAIQPTYDCFSDYDCVCGGTGEPVRYPVPAKGVLEGFAIGNGHLRVLLTHGDARGITVGDEVPVSIVAGWPSPTGGYSLLALVAAVAPRRASRP